MKNFLSCRLATYGKFQDEAIEHLASIGILCAEVGVGGATPDEMLKEAETLKGKLDAAGMRASSVQARIDLKSADPVADFEPWCKVSKVLGNEIIFLSVKSVEGDMPRTYSRLHDLGDMVAGYGLTVGMETHPDLVTNGTVGRQSMEGIKHPNIGVNFDTANVYYYNEGVDSPTELQKVLKWVVSVHLKDTDGSYHGWCFPAFGEGIVDFKAVFDILNARGFYGPWTFEIEGVQGDEFGLDLIRGRVEKSLAHLKSVGCI